MDLIETANSKLSEIEQLLKISVIELEAGHAVIRMEKTDCGLNLHGTVHGGAIFTMMDTAAGMAASYKGGEKSRPVVTQNSNVNYLRPLVSEYAICDGRMIKDGGRVALSEVNVYDEDNNLTATGQFNLYYID